MAQFGSRVTTTTFPVRFAVRHHVSGGWRGAGWLCGFAVGTRRGGRTTAPSPTGPMGEQKTYQPTGIHVCYNSDILKVLKHQFDIDLETCLRVLRSIHSMISMHSRCCKLLVVALLRVTVRQEDCVDWLRQHGAKDVGLVGHSRGGVTISQLEGDFCRVTWMTWIPKAMVLAEFWIDPIGI